MNCFEFYPVTSAVSHQGGPLIPDDRVSYLIPDEATELLSPILDRYDQDPIWYFEKLNFGRPPVPWAIACLDKEYSIAGHIATTRPEGGGIFFATYTQVTQPIPWGYVPKVGCIVFQNKEGLELASQESIIFEQAWNALADCSADRHWILAMDALPEDWLEQVVPGDGERYLASK